MRDRFFEPVSGLEIPRFAGVPTFMRLPHTPPDHARFSDVEVGLVGVPWDGGTTNRPGARHGPRHLRDASTMVRRLHPATGQDPFLTAACADLGDVGVNPANVDDTLERVTKFYRELSESGIFPLSAGGDHLVSLPVLRALAADRPLGMIHFDAHTDLFEGYFGGFRFTHGTPFRRAVEEGLLDPKRVVQIGIRGTCYDLDDVQWGTERGVRIVRIEEFREKGGARIMEEARTIVGCEPIYVSFDIDVLDPSCAPGTGTPEIGGLNTYEAQELIRDLHGLDIVAADLVEVSPPFDSAGITAFAGASLMFELLCPITESVSARRIRQV